MRPAGEHRTVFGDRRGVGARTCAASHYSPVVCHPRYHLAWSLPDRIEEERDRAKGKSPLRQGDPDPPDRAWACPAATFSGFHRETTRCNDAPIGGRGGGDLRVAAAAARAGGGPARRPMVSLGGVRAASAGAARRARRPAARPAGPARGGHPTRPRSRHPGAVGHPGRCRLSLGHNGIRRIGGGADLGDRVHGDRGRARRGRDRRDPGLCHSRETARRGAVGRLGLRCPAGRRARGTGRHDAGQGCPWRPR
ncbi:hypothetical protein CJ469_01339 [Nocardia farcinica]|nr:hypothetical protein CJ469_01339 [Nocardia farcinica]PFX08615.1 hypothetical protein CJ468_02356 [Nocardia farcinica]